LNPQRFQIDVPEARIERIRSRLRDADWTYAPDDDVDWRYGIDLAYLRSFVDHWLERYDWRAAESRLNRHPQFQARVEDIDLHFYHEKGSGPRPLPLILTHGWPGSVLEFQNLIEPLCHPERFGADSSDSFDVVVPSLPGYGFSGRPPRPIGPRRVAGLWAKLMTEVLGYPRFGAQGGDWGSAVTSWLGVDAAPAVAGIHLNLCIIPMQGKAADEDEHAWRQAYREVQGRESAYMFEQMTKPQTIAAALTDSPLGFAAWVLEKFQRWGDTHGDIESRFSRDDLITNLMLYLATGTVGSAIWLYHGAVLEAQAGRIRDLQVRVPTGIAVFPGEFLPCPPRQAIERYYNVQRWTHMSAGGHFAALEEPQALIDDVRAFFRPLR
jgi:microsomal epoxide hydrolase